jgi:poly(3-hydroxybutyrate) depolymerase
MRRSHVGLLVTALTCAACGSNGATASNVPNDAGQTPALDGANGDSGDDATSSSSPPPPTTLPDGAVVTSTPPPALNIDVSQTSVSGMSSGGYMAVQFGVAFSSIVKGIGVFAGGPFGCAQGSITTAETECSSASNAPDVTPLVTATKNLATAGKIDDTSNLATARIYIFGGADDVVVNPVVVDATQTYFAAFVPSASIQYESRHAATGHTTPTLAYGGSCDSSFSPWIGKCDYDGAGIALAQIYGTLAAPSTTPAGLIATLAQADFVANPASHSLGDTAYVYVPASCAAGERCRVHVAFHGCEMNADGAEGSAFYLHAGYNAWADTNHLVVLYPQTTTSAANSDACWDWWGYDSADYDTQAAPQMAMVRAMITSLATGLDGGLGDAGGD